jgi:hypothetical protein
MPFQESLAQRDARVARETFFGMTPLAGPQLPKPPALKESPSQVSRRLFKEKFFEPKSLRPTSIGKVSEAAQTQDPPRARHGAVTGGKTKNEARGTGTLIFQDCDGAEILRTTGMSGFEGERVIRTGCEDSSSYPYP